MYEYQPLFPKHKLHLSLQGLMFHWKIKLKTPVKRVNSILRHKS